MARRTSATAELQKLIRIFTPRIRKAFLDAVQDISDRAIIGELTEAIRDGDLNRAIYSLGLDEAAFRSLTAEIEQAFETGGVTTGNTFPKRINTQTGRTVFRFDVRNSRAEATLRDHSSTLVREITEETRRVVRVTVQRGMAEGRNPRSTALDLVGRVDSQTGRRSGGVIGLTSKQEQWVANAKRDLENLDSRYFTRTRRDKRFDSIVKKAIADGKPLDSATIDKLIGRYKDSLLQYRAESIARTESIAALNRSEHEAINQAVEQGAIKSSAIKRVWDSAGNDGRTRDTHLQMEGQTVGLNEPFTFPDGSKAMFPGDNSLGAPAEEIVMCRCIARTVIDWLADARDVVTAEERAAIAALSDDELFGGR